MDQDEATEIILRWLRDAPRDAGHYGYDLYLPSVQRAYAVEEDPQRRHGGGIDQYVRDTSPHFYAAAWELCRRGVLRPGVWRAGEQVTDDGSGGNGYSIMPIGRAYLEQDPGITSVPLGSGRFEQMIEPFAAILGPGFQERAGEAIKSYRAGAYVACCAMAGAATESLMLAVAVAKTEDEEAVLATYVTNTGRRRVENMILGQAAEHIRREFAFSFC
jgi:hypothetical protein